MKTSRKKLISTFLKIGISIFLLYLVFTKISITEILSTLENVKFVYILFSIVFFLLSQWLSAKRLLYFFKENGFNLSNQSNIILYLIGMFYNFFIPGGIGGDAYKIYILKKNFNWSAKSLTSAVFVDRFMGLTAIGVLICLLGFNLISLPLLIWSIPILIVIIIVISYFIIKRFFFKFLNIFFKTLLISIVVQGLQIISVICIIYSFENQVELIKYIVVFLVSSVLSILSFAGIGIREYVFYEASLILEINSSISVSVGVLFSIITAMVSLFGIIFHFKNPKFKLDDHEVL